MARKLSADQRHIWELHSAGFAISQISQLTKYDESFVRATIDEVWQHGGMVVKDGS